MLKLVPKYEHTVTTLSLISLTIIIYTCSLAYYTFLMAHNKEKWLALISLFCLVFNICLALILAYFFKVNYEYIILATLASYFIYASLCVYFTKLILGEERSYGAIFQEFFPFTMSIPYIIYLVLVLTGYNYLLIVPFVLFLVLNYRSILEIVKTFKRILHSPNFINVS